MSSKLNKVGTSANDNLAAQMIAAGETVFRCATDGGYRGLFCGMGVCGECRVHVAGLGTVRACMSELPYGGDVSRHSPDLLPDLQIEDAADAVPAELNPDVLVIGAGPSGLSAAKICAREGLGVVILDERLAPGGQYYKQPAKAFFKRRDAVPDRQSREGKTLIDEVRKLGATIVNQAMVWGVDPDRSCHAVIGNRSWVFRPKTLVLATGAYERTYPFPGWVEPGVMTTGAIQTMIRSYGVLAGRRFVIAGNGPLNFQVAVETLAAGGEVAAVVEASPLFSVRRIARMLVAGLIAPNLLLKGAGYLFRLRQAGIPILTSSVVTSVEREGGGLSVQVADWRQAPGRAALSLKADVLGLGFGFHPASELSRLLGCAQDIRSDGSLVVRRDPTFETSIPGVYQIGDGAGMEGAFSAMAQGEICGAAIAERQSGRKVTASKARRSRSRHLRFQKYMWSAYSTPLPSLEFASPDTVICRCEDVRLGEVRELVAADAVPSGVKKATRCGMGECQGRYCGPIVRKLYADAGKPPQERRLYWAPRPPVRPVPLAVLARSLDGGQ